MSPSNEAGEFVSDEQSELALIFLDIDHVKPYNDN